MGSVRTITPVSNAQTEMTSLPPPYAHVAVMVASYVLGVIGTYGYVQMFSIGSITSLGMMSSGFSLGALLNVLLYRVETKKIKECSSLDAKGATLPAQTSRPCPRTYTPEVAQARDVKISLKRMGYPIIHIQAPRGLTLAALKKEIRAQTGIPEAQQQLDIGNEDRATLGKYLPDPKREELDITLIGNLSSL